MTKVLYNNTHLVNTSVDQEKTSLLKIEIEKNILSNHNKEDLVISLTDFEATFLLLFDINDEKFAELKKSQGITVDLPNFVLGLIKLLNICRSAERDKSPKNFLSLCREGSSWNLNFVTVIPMKLVTQLSLEFYHTTKLHYKNYLAECLQNCRIEKDYVRKKLHDTELALATVTKDLQDQKLSFESQLNKLRNQLQQQVNINTEESIETGSELTQDQVNRQMCFADKVSGLESVIHNVERTEKPAIPVVGTSGISTAPAAPQVRNIFSQSFAPALLTVKTGAYKPQTAFSNSTDLNSIISKGMFGFKSVAAPTYQFGATMTSVFSSNSIAPVPKLSDFSVAAGSAYHFGTSNVSLSGSLTGRGISNSGRQMMARRTLKVRRKR